MRPHPTHLRLTRFLQSQNRIIHRHYHCQTRTRPSSLHHGRLTPVLVPTRGFFNLFEQQKRDPTEPVLDPGMEKMLELNKRIHLIARLPPPNALVKAFNAFIATKRTKGLPIEDFHAVRLLQTLQAIEDQNKENETSSSLSIANLEAALEVLSNPKAEDGEHFYKRIHNELAHSLWATLQGREEIVERQKEHGYIDTVRNYVTVLCATGETAQAKELLETLPSDLFKLTYEEDIWSLVVKGFCKEGQENQLAEVVEKMEKDRPEGLSHSTHRDLFLFYSRNNNVEEARRWFRNFLLDSELSGENEGRHDDNLVYQSLLELCIRNGEMHWGTNVLQSFEEREQNLRTWDAILKASVATGKKVDDVDRMLSVMTRRSKEMGQELRPDTNTFNGLIRLAVSKGDLYLTERFFGLMERWQSKPNTQTFILQIRHRLAAGDVEGAQASYDRLRDEPISNDEDWQIMNTLLQTILAQGDVSNEVVMGLVEDLSERKRTFPADTVLALCNYHLSRDEYFEVTDLLQTYAFQFSTADRIRIRDELVNFTLSPKTETAQAWDTYMIFHQVFDLETRRDVRNKAMKFFFDRKRPDLGTHIFTRMNRHPRADTRPDAESYIVALEGSALNFDEESLEVVHNLLKLDTDVEPSTRVYNALMLARTATDRPAEALATWNNIASSNEGPTYNSLHIAFRACEKAPFGFRHARLIWDKLRQADIEISKELCTSYLGALIGQEKLEEAIKVLETIGELTGEDPDVFVVGSMYNVCLGEDDQQEIEKWTREHQPRIWEDIESRGFQVDEFLEIKRVKGIDRSLHA